MQLLEHNQKTLEQLNYYVSKEQNCCVVNPCGSGKTSVMSAFIRQYPDYRFLIFTRQKNARSYYISKDQVFLGKNVSIVTYSQMLCDYRIGFEEGYRADFYLVDEAHYIGAEKWSIAFEHYCQQNNPILIGFTATPQRYEDQGTENTIVNEYFSGNIAGNYSTKDLQKSGVFIEPEYILSIYDFAREVEEKISRVEESDLPDDKKRYYTKRLNTALKEWENQANPKLVLSKSLPRYLYKETSNRILVYVSNMNEMDDRMNTITRIIKEIIGEKKVKAYRYTYRDRESELASFLKEDDNYVKILFSIDKIMETIHIDDLNIMLMLRPSVSNRIITQQFGRINSIGNDRCSLIVDMVDNLSNLNSVSFAQSITERTRSENKNISVCIPNISLYMSIFDEIDKVLSRFPVYHYNGFYGSLSQICCVFNRNYQEIKELCGNGIELEDAIKKTKPERGHHITDDTFYDQVSYPDFTLTEEQKKEVQKYLYIVDSVCKRRNVEDEDMRQNLCMELMYRISLVEPGKERLAGKLRNNLNSKYTNLYRAKVIREGIYTSFEEQDNRQSEQDIEQDLMKREVRTAIIKELENCTDRVKNVMYMRFGFHSGKAMALEDVGKELSVTRERVRQIEARELRILRGKKWFRSPNGYRRYLELEW